MESMIRKVVVEEVTKAINGINDDKPILVKDDSPTQPKPAQPKKKQRTLNRMSKLLATVNSKGNKSKNKSSDFKSIKIQIRWQKRGEEAFVKTEYGGGQRYVQFGDQDDPTFLELLSKGQSYYYPNGENGFEEKLENAVCKILSAGGQRIPNNQKIREYLDENGCFPSKTYFVFETKDLSDDYDNDDDGDNKLAPFPLRPIDQISGSSKRKICSTCSGTYLDFCLRCDQDQAFKESLNTDQLKEKENQENHQGKLENNEIHNLQNTDETRESLGIGDIRQKRLSFFKGAPNDSYDENLAVIRSKFKSSEWEHKEFSIRRRFVVKDVLTKMKIFFQDKPLEPVKATFLSCGSTEAAVDDGGPMKELVTMFYEKINGVLTQGPPNNQVLIHDSAVLKREDYFYFGKFVSLCILQGLDTPKQFSKGLVEYIIDGSQSCSCTIGDIVDPDLCQKLKKIIDASESEFSEAVDNFPERFDLGYNEFNPKFLDKSKLIQAVAHSFTVSSKLEEIQQFMDGLATFGVLDLLRQFPIEGKKLLLFENEVSPVALKKSFVCKQQNESEQNVIFNLYNLIDEISSKKFKNVSAFTFDEVEEGIVADEKKRNLKFTLADILMFFTGSRFLQPSLQIPVKFNDKSTRRLSVSTCLPEVVFPLSERYTGEMFSDNFIEDVLCSPGFGNA